MGVEKLPNLRGEHEFQRAARLEGLAAIAGGAGGGSGPEDVVSVKARVEVLESRLREREGLERKVKDRNIHSQDSIMDI